MDIVEPAAVAEAVPAAVAPAVADAADAQPAPTDAEPWDSNRVSGGSDDGVAERSCVLVYNVGDGGAAAGVLAAGDLLVRINGTRVENHVHGTDLLKAACGAIEVVIERDGAGLSVSLHKPEVASRLGITLTNMHAEEPAQPAAQPASAAGVKKGRKGSVLGKMFGRRGSR